MATARRRRTGRKTCGCWTPAPPPSRRSAVAAWPPSASCSRRSPGTLLPPVTTTIAPAMLDKSQDIVWEWFANVQLQRRLGYRVYWVLCQYFPLAKLYRCYGTTGAPFGSRRMSASGSGRAALCSEPRRLVFTANGAEH